MTYVFESLVAANVILASMYLTLTVVVVMRLKWLHKTSPELNTRKLFVMTCLLSAILRTMSFASMAALDYNEFTYKMPSDVSLQYDDSTTGIEDFFEKATLVLFDFPDFCIISAFVLLIVVWAECFLLSRRHWLSSLSFRRISLLSYLVFNILLYSCQIALYSVLFIPTINQELLSEMIYLTLACFNLVLPVIWSLIGVYLSMKFAGFPYSSPDAKERLHRLSLVMVLWTITRIVWGFLTLTTVSEGWLTDIKHSKLFNTLVMIGIFAITEILPIAISMRMDLLNSLGEVTAARISRVHGHYPHHHHQQHHRSGLYAQSLFNMSFSMLSDDSEFDTSSENTDSMDQRHRNNSTSSVHSQRNNTRYSRSRSIGEDSSLALLQFPSNHRQNYRTNSDVSYSSSINNNNNDNGIGNDSNSSSPRSPIIPIPRSETDREDYDEAYSYHSSSYCSARSGRSDTLSSGVESSLESEPIFLQKQRQQQSDVTKWQPKGLFGAWLGF